MRTDLNATTAIARNNAEEFLNFRGKQIFYLSSEQDQSHILNF